MINVFNRLSMTILMPLVVAGAASGCSLSSSGNLGTGALTTQCLVPTDQSGTISGAWPVIPIPVALDQNSGFSSTETTAITNAISSWNNFFTASKSITVINAGSGSSPPTSTTPVSQFQQNLCANAFLQGTSFQSNVFVVIYKLATWNSSYPPSAIALTNFCTQSASPYPKMFAAVMFLNYQNFFVTGTRQPDLQSVVTHEMGHLLGLNHSCESTAKTGFPNCTDPSISTDYINAVMFPSFSFDSSGVGEVRRNLNINDQERANCLYPPAA